MRTWGLGRAGLMALVLAGATLLPAVSGLGPQARAQGNLSDEERTEQSKAFYSKGREAFGRNDWQGAVDNFTKAYEMRNVPKLLQFIAQAYDKMGKVGESMQFLERYAASSAEAAAEVSEQLRILRPIVIRQMVFSASSRVLDAAELATPGPAVANRERKIVGVELGAPVFDDVPYAVFTDPPGATVYINDKAWGAAGQTPYSIKLFPGRHTVWVEKDFYEPLETEVVVKPLTNDSKAQDLRLKLVRQVVPVSIQARPETAEIVFVSDDGQSRRLGVGRWSGDLPAGPGRFVIRATGVGQREFEEVVRRSAIDETGAQTLVLNLRGAQEVELELAGRSGTAELRAGTAVGDVYVDGKFVGTTPGTISRTLSPGFHRVEVRQEGFYPWSSEVEIVPDKTLGVDLPAELVAVPDDGPSVGGITLTTLGALTLAAGGAFTLNSIQPETLTILEDTDQAQLTSFILYGVGGAALITGIILFAVDGDDPPASAWSPGLLIGPTRDGWGATVSVPIP